MDADVDDVGDVFSGVHYEFNLQPSTMDVFVFSVSLFRIFVRVSKR